MRFSGGPKVRVEQDDKIFEGELEITPEGEKFLYTFLHAIPIKKNAVITSLEKVSNPVFDVKKYDNPKTSFEIFQFEKYRNFFPEDENAETHDDLKQWHYLD